MKIVGGQFSGRKLFTPKNRDIRPTSDKIRGAIFNMLQSRGAVEGARVLDAFCGTGALGLEALSRGAEHCCFMDKAHSSLNLAKENANIFGVESACDFILKDSTKIGMRTDNQHAYDLVFLDPPYNQNLIVDTLNALKAGKWLSSDCWIMCESERNLQYDYIKDFNIDSEKIYGNIKVILLQI